MSKTTLADRAMLASLTINQWSARKYDRKVTDATNEAHGASSDAGRYNKRLLTKTAMSTISSIVSAARKDFHRRSVPWLDDGSRIVSVMAYEALQDDMRKHREAYEDAVRKFVEGYPAYVKQAKRELNGMFNPADYPSEDEIAARFGFEVRIMNVPAAADFRADVSDAQAAMIREQIEKATKDAIAAAVHDTYRRIGEVVGHMAEKLKGYRPAAKKIGDKGLFHHTLVENVKELVDVLPSLNIANDPRLDALTDRMRKQLCTTTVDVLRDSETTRKKVAKAAASIMADVESILG